MKWFWSWPAALLWACGAVFAQTASEPAPASKAGPAAPPESRAPRQGLDNAMERRQQWRADEESAAQTARQLRATGQAQERIREAIRLQDALVARDQQEVRGYERDTSSHAAMLQLLTQHQQLLEQLRSQDEQLSRVQEQLRAQQQALQQRRDQLRQQRWSVFPLFFQPTLEYPR